MTVFELLRDKRAEIRAIAERHGAADVRVFGSVARGEERADSDIDLLVRFRRGTTLLDQAALIRELAEILGRDVDVVSDKGLKERIRARVLGEAIPL